MVTLEPLDVVAAEQLSVGFVSANGAPITEVFPLVGAAHSAASHHLHRLADGGQTGGLLRLGLVVCGLVAAGAHQGLKGKGRGLFFRGDRLTLP